MMLFLSCNGKVEKSWTIRDFTMPHKFSVHVSEDKTVTNANIYLSGKFSGTVYLSKVENDSTLQFTQKNLPTKIMSDFYGGTFELYLAPSNARGNLKIRIEIQYGP